ncbi:MAG: hypothetical protein JWO51_4807 [Rhodospirillales bacterium]|nr:hypothetical protein [Rhodospirillales bacterium]
MSNEISLDEIVELDETAPPGINGERARQQAEFHGREVRELAPLITADPSRRAEQLKHRELELLCRELALAFAWLTEKDRPSTDLDLAMAHLRETYEASPELALLREIAETQYPLLTRITFSRSNAVGLLDETRLSLKHAARGRPLADTMEPAEADQMLIRWLESATATPGVPLLPVHEALEWFRHLAAARGTPDHGRPLEDDLEATIYLARGTLEAAGFAYRGPEEPAPGY